jgi:hypothetical protein
MSHATDGNHNGFGYTDCADFASRALVFGGYRMVKPSKVTGYVTNDKYWFYQSPGAYSSSWGQAWDLYTFLTQYDQSPVIASFDLTKPWPSLAKVKMGDLVFADWPDSGKPVGKTGGITHVGVVAVVLGGDLLIAQHSPDHNTDLLYWKYRGGPHPWVWVVEPR